MNELYLDINLKVFRVTHRDMDVKPENPRHTSKLAISQRTIAKL